MSVKRFNTVHFAWLKNEPSVADASFPQWSSVNLRSKYIPLEGQASKFDAERL
mgnify:CR=1 FL=1